MFIISNFTNKFMMDPVGNSVAIVTLLLMIASAISVIVYFNQEKDSRIDHIPSWLVPVLAIAGILISIYLSIIEFTQSEAFCGPVGDCNSVQQSPYAKLFGVIPIGIIGIIGYAIILVLWIFARYTNFLNNKLFDFIIWVFAWFGLLFSIYLTFLEPFVIGATCMWCISSALVMTLLLWASSGNAKKYWLSMEDED